jgi:hypothetical protein
MVQGAPWVIETRCDRRPPWRLFFEQGNAPGRFAGAEVVAWAVDLRDLGKAISPGAQTIRPDDAEPVNNLQGGMTSPAASCCFHKGRIEGLASSQTRASPPLLIPPIVPKSNTKNLEIFLLRSLWYGTHADTRTYGWHTRRMDFERESLT